MKTLKLTTICLTATIAIPAVIVVGTGSAQADCTMPDWVKQAFIMGTTNTPCLEIAAETRFAQSQFTPPYRLQTERSVVRQNRTQASRRVVPVESRGTGRIKLRLADSSLRSKHTSSGHKSEHWGYRTGNGPAHWSAMSDKFKTCGIGKRQSPIDIPSLADTGVGAISFNYNAGPATVVNNGHTIQVNVAKGNTLNLGDRIYRLVQFHFHTPSENTIDGLHYPMEAHMVHADSNGRLAVVALMIRSGRKGMVDLLPRPAQSGRTADASTVDPSSLLPLNKKHYEFTGSLTTPPCSESVSWIVMKQPIEANISTIAEFYSILGANNRPTNPLNGRQISLAR